MESASVEKRVKLDISSAENISDVKVVKTKTFPDDRGYFNELYNEKEFKQLFGFAETFKQDNHSFSKCGVLRGLHIQPGMGKLVSVISGCIYDVAVDIRPGSKTYGQHCGIVLNAKDNTSFYVPDGFLHGFLVLSEEGAHVLYKCTDVYNPQSEYGVNPFDPEINIDWPTEDKSQLIVSDRDKQHPNLAEKMQRG